MAWGGTQTWAYTDTLAAPDAELNRIEANADYLDTALAHASLPAMTHKTNRVPSDGITVAEIANIEKNCQEFALAYALTFVGKAMLPGVAVDYTDINRWENTLAAVKVISDLAPASLDYCGTLYTGEDGDIY